MSDQIFTEGLEFLRRSDVKQVRLLGGEPTLHPRFPEFIRQALDEDFEILVFSNGLIPEPALRCLEEISPDKVKVLINMADDAEGGKTPPQRVHEALRRLGSKVNPGYNICRPTKKLNFLFDLIESYGLTRQIRLGLAHPRFGGNNQFLHPRYYKAVGKFVDEFLVTAVKKDVSILFDCGFVPCMFEGSNFLFDNPATHEIGRRCNPILDILPDGEVIACYPLEELCRIKLGSATDAKALRLSFEEMLKTYRALTLYKKCGKCTHRIENRCVGGCLSAAIRRLRH